MNPAPADNLHRENRKNVYSFAELQAQEFPKLQPAIEGLLYQGQVGFLCGAYAVGKTFFSHQMTACMAMGRDLVGRKIPHPYNVSFFDLENGAPLIKERSGMLLEELAPSVEERELLNQNWHYVDCLEEGELQGLTFDPEGFKKFEAHIAEYQPQVVIIDCYGKVFPGDETNEKETKALLNRVTDCKRRHECLQNGILLFLHHVTKPDAKHEAPDLLNDPRSLLAKMRGTGRLLDLTPVRLAIDEQIAGGDSVHIVNGLNRNGVVSPLVLQRTDSGFFALHDDKGFVAKKLFESKPVQCAALDAVNAFLRNATSVKFTDIQRMHSWDGRTFHIGTINDMLKTSCANNLLKKNKDGSYSLAV